MPAMTSVTLIIVADNLDPEIVTRAVGAFPDHSWIRGERPSFTDAWGSTREHMSVAEQGVWKKGVPHTLLDAELSDQLSYWATFLAGRVPALSQLVSNGYDIEINCYFSSSEAEV